MPWRARMCSWALCRTASLSRRGMDSVWSPTHKKPQRSVIGTCLRALTQRRAWNRAHHRPAPAIDHRHNRLRGAGQIEDDPVVLRARGRDLHEVPGSYLIHERSLEPCALCPADIEAAALPPACAARARRARGSSPRLPAPTGLPARSARAVAYAVIRTCVVDAWPSCVALTVGRSSST